MQRRPRRARRRRAQAVARAPAEDVAARRAGHRGGFARAAEAELADARPLRDNAYKLALARNLIVRTLAELAGGSVMATAAAPGRRWRSTGSRGARRSPAPRCTPTSTSEDARRLRRDRAVDDRQGLGPLDRRSPRRSRVDGVLAVLAHENAPRLHEPRASSPCCSRPRSPTAARSSPPSSPRRSRSRATRPGSCASSTTRSRTTSCCAATIRGSTSRTRSTRASTPTPRWATSTPRSRRPRSGRRDLRDAGLPQQPDGAARDARRSGTPTAA